VHYLRDQFIIIRRREDGAHPEFFTGEWGGGGTGKLCVIMFDFNGML